LSGWFHSGTRLNSGNTSKKFMAMANTMSSNQTRIPVLIAGGGPVGMTLALFLAHYNVPTILVERNPRTTTHPKMDLTNGRSMELYRKIDLVDKLRAVGVPGDNPFDIVWLTNMVGHELHRFAYPSSNESAAAAAAENDGTHTAESAIRVSQIVIEPVFKEAIDSSPLVDVRFNTRFERIVSSDEQGVIAEIVDNESGTVQQIRCQYLAGCDGGGSRVRRHLGIDLDGDMGVAAAYMVHFRSSDPAIFKKWGTVWHYQNAAGTIIAQDDVDTWTLQRWIIPGEDVDSLTPEQVLETWVGSKFNYEILQANPWEANLVVSNSYTSGRILLAGDAAHQYIPTGGYGMNSGVADAAGLAWMLAALVQGWGGNRLVAAHDSERRATAWWHLNAAKRHFNVRLQIAELYMESGELDKCTSEAKANRGELGKKISVLGNAENESWGVEHGYRYDQSPVIVYDSDEPPEIDPLIYTPNTLPGARLPHVFLEEGVSIYDRLGSFFTLILFGEEDAAIFSNAAVELGIPLSVLKLDRPELLPIYQKPCLLVRPDHHIAWRGDAPPEDIKGLMRKVCGW
jgi:2-polyprenyl-6-methoxyphenol hydroxylase-like FAD-dependent oxidoreductase